MKETPNPDVQKFLPTPPITVLPAEFGHTMEFNNEKEARQSPLASKLFEIPEVSSVLFGDQYICVTRKDGVDWEYINPAVFHVVLDFFSTKEPQPIVLRPEDIPEDPNDVKETDSEVVKLIKELLGTRIRPRIKADGGDIFFQGFDDASGVVKVKLTGACKGCASSSVTLKQGVEQMMKHYIPEVKSVESVEDPDTPEVKAAKEKAEKELRKDFEDELAAAIADEMKKMKKRRYGCSDSR